MDNDEVERMLRGRTHELANKFAEIHVAMIEMERRILAAISDQHEAIAIIESRCENCGRLVCKLENAVFSDIGVKSNGDKAGGMVDVVRLHHLKIREFEAIHKMVKSSLLKMAVGLVASSGVGGAIVAAAMKLLS